MRFSARLIQILFLLLRSDKPIPAGVLAENLQISKRTIFRELRKADNCLKEYDLSLDTKSKKGVSITGNESDENRLLEELKNLEYIDPQNRKERHNHLILELLKQEEPQKMYYYSSLLKVSEGTISNDLDTVENWFLENNIKLVRKSGLGIYLDYKEEDYRKACMRYVYQNSEDPFKLLSDLIEPDIIDKIIASMKHVKNSILSEMAESSYTELTAYLSIITKRVLMGRKNIREKSIDLTEKNIRDYEFVIELISMLGGRFSIEYTTTDIIDVYIYIKGSKLQHINESEDVVDTEPDIRYMIYEMIQQYDSTIAYQLKQDTDFIKGLIAHVRPTIVRLKHGIEIQNPFQDEIKDLYPRVYEKAQRAAKVIEEKFDVEIPEQELGLLAIHFGGAEVRLKNNYKFRRKVNVGVICSSGIGISALLSSRISNIFHDKVRIRTLSFEDLYSDKISDVEILISTFDLNTSKYNYIKVNAMLTEKDVLLISKEIENVLKNSKLDESTEKTDDTLTQVEKINLISREISSIIKNFELYTVNSYIQLDEIMTFVSEILGENESNKNYIYNDLKKREMLSTQVIPEFEFVLLHAKTKGVDESKFILIKPESDHFENEYFSKAKVALVMLIPEGDPRDVPAISSISSALFEDEIFLDDIKNGNREAVKSYIEEVLKEYLAEQIKNL
ncbi:MAG: transcription antiterminator [Clostridium sp.]|jgi:mannitol operon transcriptional antiterminator|uniref:BglG family transcription antiterminator n=1 Tax=Clostridium sp. TaxID=1506 RepID=UPI0025BCA969|nr:transcription antiterminator [Clostridium sp.]MCH3964261.1 transcription antiterminator [Clostridium sp.]MCI1715441.1 transcription antiterminator [Clostridium sp.]MCI1799768.1 transcription antiterminator [Clostridium sp.]MCI1813624.1 transcription antiterminator [Clostridium sp.]MCI1870585.1 transcription antiterminator [Clostridium sp.]